MRLNKIRKGSEKLTIEKARLVAHFIGDGAVFKCKHNYTMKYEVTDSESLNQVHDDLLEVYGLKPYLFWNTSGKTGKLIPFIILRSKLIYEDLMRYATYYSKDWVLKSLIMNSPRKIKVEFLRAFYDDEGSVLKKEIKLYSINKEGLEQIKILMKELGFDKLKIYSGYGCMRNVYALVTRNLNLFHEKIGFCLKRKQNKLIKYLKNN